MKKRFALILTLILATGTLTACTEENFNNDINTSVVSATADVSASERFSKSTTEKQSTKITTVSKNTEPTEKDTNSKVKTDTEQKLESESQNITAQETEKVETTVAPSTAKATQSTTVKPTEKNTQKSTQKPTEKVTQKSTQKVTVKPTEKTTQQTTKKEMNLQKAVSSCISYGTQLGMNYDPSLNTANASWFSPTNSVYYDDTQSLITACYEDINYVAYYYEDDGIKPSDMSFNVIELNKKIYVVYC